MRKFIAVAAGALSTTAWGQTAQEETVADEQEVVVIGTREQGYRATVAVQTNKSDTPIKETPFSVQVVTRELIEDRGITTIGEALRYVPGFSPQVGFVGSNDRFYIRGFITPYNLKNGLRRSAYSPDEQLQNIEQVEVLKGPASALYGRFEPGGVVNFVTKKPQALAFAEVGALYGSFDQLRLTFDGNAPLNDTVGFRLNASFDDKESWRDFGFSRDLFVAPVLQWRPAGGATTVTLEGEYARKRGYADRGFANNPIFLDAPRDRQYGEPDARYRNRGGVVSLFVDHRFSDVFSGRIALGRSDFTKDTFYYSYGLPPVSGATTATPRVNRRVSDAYDRQRDTTAQAELYARFSTGPIEHKALVGTEISADHWRFDVRTTPFGVNLPIDFNNPVYGQRATPTVLASDGAWNTDSQAIYGQDELKFGNLRLLGGLRYDWTKGRAFERTLGTDTATRREKLSPRAGITWTPAPAISLYASWSRSFRGQVDVGRLRNGELPKPLIGEAYEAGVKASLLGDRLRPTIAVFDITRRNTAVADPTDPNFEFVIQVGKSRSRGVEIEVPFVVSRDWRIIANYTHLDATVREDSFLAPGLQLVNAPRDSASLWTTYDLSGSLRGASVGVGAQHIGRRAANTNNSFFLPAYTRIDANLSYAFEVAGRPLRAQLNVLNLFDTFYYDSGGGFIPLYPGAPRAVTFGLGYRFGATR